MEAPQELLAALAAHGEKLAAELRALICLRCKPGKPCAQCQAGKRKRAPQLRETLSRTTKKAKGPQVEAPPDPKQRWAVDPEIDRDTRRDCVGT